MPACTLVVALMVGMSTVGVSGHPAVAAEVKRGGSEAAAGTVDWKTVETEALDLLQAYVRIDTTNPSGDVTKAVDMLEGVLKRNGIETKRYVTDPARGTTSLLARLRGRGQGRPLLMLSHMDVVPADPARWHVAPFSATIKDGEVWGRGTLDMKGLGVIQLMSMLALKRAGSLPGRDLLLLFNSDEESGGEKGARWMVEHAWRDLQPAFVLDEGGAGTRGVFASDARTVFGVSVDEKRVLWIRITATGDSGHGSRPGRLNAVTRISQAIAKLPASVYPRQESPVVIEMKHRLGGPLADNAVTRALAATTVTPTTLQAGVGVPPKVNVIPGGAVATVDCRLLPGESSEDLLRTIRAAVGDSATMIEIIQAPVESGIPAWDTALFHAIERTVERHVPGAMTIPVVSTGGTDARFFRAKGVPAYGFLPYVLTPEQLALWHADNERITLDEFFRGLRIYHDLLVDVLAE